MYTKDKIIFFNCFKLLRRIVYLSLGKFDNLFGRKNKLVILCYHSIDKDAWLFSTSVNDFDKQMSFMKSNYKVVNMRRINSILSGQPKLERPVFAITFDDGYESVLKAEKITSKYGIKPTIFVFPDSKEVDRNILGNRKKLMNDDNLQYLIKRGWEVGSHGLRHVKLSDLNLTEINKEISESKNKIERIINKKVNYFSYPFGNYNSEIVFAVKKAGYSLAVSMDDEIIGVKTNPYILPRVGVNNSHSMDEFKYLSSPSVVWFRGLLKKTIFERYI